MTNINKIIISQTIACLCEHGDKFSKELQELVSRYPTRTQSGFDSKIVGQELPDYTKVKVTTTMP